MQNTITAKLLLTLLTFLFLRLCCERDNLFWLWITVLKLVQLETSSFFKFLLQRCVLASWCEKKIKIQLLCLPKDKCKFYSKNYKHLPLKSVANTAGTCMIMGGEYPAAFLAITEMLTAE